MPLNHWILDQLELFPQDQEHVDGGEGLFKCLENKDVMPWFTLHQVRILSR